LKPQKLYLEEKKEERLLTMFLASLMPAGEKDFLELT